MNDFLYPVEIHFEKIIELSTETGRITLELSDEDLLNLVNQLEKIRIRKPYFIMEGAVRFRGAAFCLPPTHCAILKTLLKRPQHLILWDELVLEVWNGFIDPDSVKNSLQRLRKIFRDNGVPLPLRTFTQKKA